MIIFCLLLFIMSEFGVSYLALPIAITVAIVCAIQLLFCFKIRRAALKLIPLYVLFVEAAACGIYLLAVTGWDAFIGWVCLVGVGIAAVGAAIAWVIFAAGRCVRSRKIDT